MPISMAYRLKPDAAFVGVDFDYYDEVSRRVMSVLKVFAGKFEQVSVDEAFMDVSGKVYGHAEAEAYAARVKKAVLNGTGLKCSIGVGPNRLIAKMACSKAKPDGIRVVGEEDARSFLSGMGIIELYGVGSKTAEKLAAMGYRTVDQLAKANAVQMIGKFGSFGGELIRYANGIDDSEVTENSEIKSIGREFTFESDTDDRKAIRDRIGALSMQVAGELDRAQECYKTVTLKLRYSDFTERLHSRSVRMTSNPETLARTALELYGESSGEGRRIRKLGVRASNLVSRKGQRRIE